MKISYIIPAYNVPPAMLRACLESICPACDYEIILIDDGSATPVQVEAGPHAGRLRLVRTANGGPSVARNTGLSLATGDYIHFLDADDALIRPQYDEVLRLLAERRPDILSFHFATTPTPEEQRAPRIVEASATHILRHTNVRSGSPMYLFRRTILGDLRFEPGIQHEDERFTPQLYLRAQTVVATNIPAYFYRQREGSRQHSFDRALVDKRLSDLCATIRFLKSLHQPALRRRIFCLHIDYLYNYLHLKVLPLLRRS